MPASQAGDTGPIPVTRTNSYGITQEIFSRPDSLVISDVFVGAVSGRRITGAAAF